MCVCVCVCVVRVVCVRAPPWRDDALMKLSPIGGHFFFGFFFFSFSFCLLLMISKYEREETKFLCTTSFDHGLQCNKKTFGHHVTGLTHVVLSKVFRQILKISPRYGAFATRLGDIAIMFSNYFQTSYNIFLLFGMLQFFYIIIIIIFIYI